MSNTTANFPATPTRLTDTATLRECARRQIEDGALTQNYGAELTGSRR